MIRQLTLLTTLTCAAGLAVAGNITLKSAEKTKAVIDAAVEAHGGAALENIETVTVHHETTFHAVEQSRKTTPPWDTNKAKGMNAIDLADSMFLVAARGDGGGYEFNNATVINGEKSFQVDYRAGTATPIAEPDFATTSGPFVRVTPALLVREVQQRIGNAYYLGQHDHNGRPHDVVGFSMTVGPAISLYFDAESHLLTHSERIVPGFGLIEYGFLDYETVAGVPFPTRFELHQDGDLNMERKNTATTVNENVDQFASVDASLKRLDALAPDPLTRNELADGVWLIGGSGTYAMFIDMDEYVIAVGGTAGLPQRIESLREAIGDKPIRYGVLTHHHSDHVLAVPAYAAEGATVITPKAHRDVVAATVDDDVKLKIETVGDRKVLEAGSRRVEFIDIGPTRHTEHLLVTWLPKEKILFEADHFTMPRTGVVGPAVKVTHSFAKALRRAELEPAMLVTAHSPLTATLDDLRESLDKKPVKTEKMSAIGR